MMNSNDFTNELSYLIRARYSIINVNTFEEERALEYIAKVVRPLDKRIITWTLTKGFELEGKALDNKSIDLSTALTMAVDLAKEPTIFVWIDIHPFFKSQSSMVYIRKFKELSQQVRKGSPSNSIILSPNLEIPTELQKDITLLDFPLPDFNDTRTIIDNFTNYYLGKQSLTIEKSKKVMDDLARAAVGLSQAEIENSLAKSLVKNRGISGREVNLILEEKKQIIRKSGILEYIPTENFNLDDIGGLQNLKRWLQKRKLSYTMEAREYGIEWPNGVLLTGVSGCGKSLCAKSIASSWKMPLLRLDIGKVFSGLVGSSEANMRTVLSICETVSPSILWIDEIEKALSGIGNGSSDGGTAIRIFGTLLTWMQEKTSPVFVFATANNIDGIPPELLRKGRFDEIFFVDLPNNEERAEIFKIHIEKLGRNINNFDIEKLVEYSGEKFWGDGVKLTGAEIESVIREGLLESFCDKIDNQNTTKDLSTEDIVTSITRSVPLAQIRKNEIKALRNWASENAVRASKISQDIREEKVEVSVGRNIDF